MHVRNILALQILLLYFYFLGTLATYKMTDCSTVHNSMACNYTLLTGWWLWTREERESPHPPPSSNDEHEVKSKWMEREIHGMRSIKQDAIVGSSTRHKTWWGCRRGRTRTEWLGEQIPIWRTVVVVGKEFSFGQSIQFLPPPVVLQFCPRAITLERGQ